mgnify:CR=1 FL=1
MNCKHRPRSLNVLLFPYRPTTCRKCGKQIIQKYRYQHMIPCIPWVIVSLIVGPDLEKCLSSCITDRWAFIIAYIFCFLLLTIFAIIFIAYLAPYKQYYENLADCATRKADTNK